MRQYGFVHSLDLEFGKWYAAANRARSTGPPDDQLMAGYDITFGEGRKRTLRTKVKAACARLHGVKQ